MTDRVEEAVADGGGSLDAIAARHGFGPEAAAAAREALRTGGGRQAQFRHPELGGMGQWSAGGMLMIGDMFNDGLKARVGALFRDLASAMPTPERGPGAEGSGAPPTTWPADLGTPASTGSQNGMRYAIFPDKRRVAVERDGEVTLYDTGEHRFTGVSQQQGGSRTLSFSGTGGTVALDALREVVGGPLADTATPGGGGDVADQIGRLHDLLVKGALTEDEFAAAKRRLIERI